MPTLDHVVLHHPLDGGEDERERLVGDLGTERNITTHSTPSKVCWELPSYGALLRRKFTLA